MVLRRRFASLMIGALAITVEAGLMTGLAGICHAQAQDTDPGQKIVKEVHLSNADLQAAISLVQKDTGVEIVIEPSDKPYGPVNLSLDNRTLDFVLKAMAKSAGASVRYESGVYIIGPKDAVPAKETSPVQNDRTEKTSTPPEETAPV